MVEGQKLGGNRVHELSRQDPVPEGAIGPGTTGALSEWARALEMSATVPAPHTWELGEDRAKLTWGLTIRSTAAAAWSPDFPAWERAGTWEAH